jgi:hypothetical protein
VPFSGSPRMSDWVAAPELRGFSSVAPPLSLGLKLYSTLTLQSIQTTRNSIPIINPYPKTYSIRSFSRLVVSDTISESGEIMKCFARLRISSRVQNLKTCEESHGIPDQLFNASSDDDECLERIWFRSPVRVLPRRAAEGPHLSIHPYIYPESMHGMIKYDQKPS